MPRCDVPLPREQRLALNRAHARWIDPIPCRLPHLRVASKISLTSSGKWRETLRLNRIRGVDEVQGEIELPPGGIAAPIQYMLNGKLAICSGLVASGSARSSCEW